MRHGVRLLTAAMLATVIGAISLGAQSQGKMTHATPGTSNDPVWQARLQLSDGRTFLTDGALAFDADLAKTKALPDRQVPGKVLETYMSAPHTDECGLGDLKATADGLRFTTPSGLPLNSTYINYLRRTLRAGATRLRSSGPLNPIIVFTGGKAVGVLMPMAK